MPLDHFRIAYDILFGDDDPNNLEQTIRDRPKVLTISWDEMVSAVQRVENLARQQLVQEQQIGIVAETTDALAADRSLRGAPGGSGRRIGGPGGGLVTRTVPFAGAATLTPREAQDRFTRQDHPVAQDLPVQGYADLPPGRVPPNPTEQSDT